MKKGFFSEPLFLIALTLTTLSALSTPAFFAPDNAQSQTLEQYELATQLQHLRFILDQETAYQINQQNEIANNCTGTFNADYAEILNAFNSQTGLNCILANNPVSFANNASFSVTATCEKNNSSITQRFSFQKQSQENSGGTDCEIRDLQSGDFDTASSGSFGGNATCIVYATPSQIGPNQTTQIQVQAQGFQNLPLTPSATIDCGNNSTTNASCSGSACNATCGPYAGTGNFSIDTNLNDGTNSIDCTAAAITVTAPIVNGSLGQWKMTETGGAFNDSSGATNPHALVRNNVLTSTNDAAAGYSAYFGGQTAGPGFRGYLNTANTPYLALAN